MAKKIESSRYANKTAWFHGDGSQGDYYDQATGTYWGSWTRAQGDHFDPDKAEANLFLSDDWKNRQNPKNFLSSRLVSVVDQIKQIVVPVPDPLQLEGQYLAFIGDSFCAHLHDTDHQRFKQAGHDMRFRCKTLELTYTSLVAQQMKLNLAPYGFAGRSWWWSWQKFLEHWEQSLHRIDAMIFVHTGADRINNADDPDLPHIPLHTDVWPTEHMKAEAYETYIRHIHDHRFQLWAQRQFFRYLRDILPPVKILHFFVSQGPSDDTCNMLPGMIFRTPLMLLSCAETKGGRLIDMPFPDYRPNHFNEHNNQAMARLIVQSLTDYQPGAQDIPWREFYQARPKNFRKTLSSPQTYI